MPDGAFDIHYVDADDKEIPPEKTLAAQIKYALPPDRPRLTRARPGQRGEKILYTQITRR